MQFYLSILIGILIIIIAILALRLYLMQKSAREIRQEFAKRYQYPDRYFQPQPLYARARRRYQRTA